MIPDTENKQDAPAMPNEQAAEFAALQALADEPGAAGAPVPEPEQDAAPDVPLAVQISGLLAMVVGVAKPMFPSLETIYTPEVVEQVGVALQPVCDKYGWLQEGIGGKYGPEIMALAVVGPLAYATYAGISSDIAARKPDDKKSLPVGPSAPVQIDTKANGDESRLSFNVGKVIPHENG